MATPTASEGFPNGSLRAWEGSLVPVYRGGDPERQEWLQRGHVAGGDGERLKT